jgi:hypothetical protein
MKPGLRILFTTGATIANMVPVTCNEKALSMT